MSAAPPFPLSLEDLAALLIVAERDCKAAEKNREAIRWELLERMAEGEVKKIELPEALVTYLEPSSADVVDGTALKAKVEALGARLRDLGLHDVDDAVPTKVVRRAAGLRITARLAPS
jgi:hypothetical protein